MKKMFFLIIFLSNTVYLCAGRTDSGYSPKEVYGTWKIVTKKKEICPQTEIPIKK